MYCTLHRLVKANQSKLGTVKVANSHHESTNEITSFLPKRKMFEESTQLFVNQAQVRTREADVHSICTNKKKIT